jgi:hypothetical protein
MGIFLDDIRINSVAIQFGSVVIDFTTCIGYSWAHRANDHTWINYMLIPSNMQYVVNLLVLKHWFGLNGKPKLFYMFTTMLKR